MAVRGQQIWELESCCCRSLATRWSLSQNCRARGSEMRDCTLPPGRDQSVGSIGSHTTRTRSRADGFCFNIFSIAEDPRKQQAQVGESSNTKRLPSAASLNSRLNWSRLLAVSDVSGAWPFGGAPQKYQNTRHARATTINKGTYFIVTRIPSPACYQARDDLGEKNNQEN